MSRENFNALQERGRILAGELGDLAQRASVYHHMYQDSNGRNVFPLIAAHGALWASGYFKKGILAGKLLSIQFALKTGKHKKMMLSLYDFADKFREINRQVCAEAYALYHYTKSNTDVPRLDLEYSYKPDFLELLYKCHHASLFTEQNRRDLFFEFFSWEQENIVAPSVDAAYNGFNWNLVKRLALRPNVEFAYFGEKNLKFTDFSSKEERINKGLKAYCRAEEVGLIEVENSLYQYGILPSQFFENPAEFHVQLSEALNA